MAHSLFNDFVGEFPPLAQSDQYLSGFHQEQLLAIKCHNQVLSHHTTIHAFCQNRTEYSDCKTLRKYRRGRGEIPHSGSLGVEFGQVRYAVSCKGSAITGSPFHDMNVIRAAFAARIFSFGGQNHCSRFFILSPFHGSLLHFSPFAPEEFPVRSLPGHPLSFKKRYFELVSIVCAFSPFPCGFGRFIQHWISRAGYAISQIWTEGLRIFVGPLIFLIVQLLSPVFFKTLEFTVVFQPAFHRAEHAVLPFGKECLLTVSTHPQWCRFVRNHQREKICTASSSE